MKSGDRLNQIEPLIAEMLIKLDDTAAKVDKVSEDVAELKIAMQKSNVIATKQSDTISFLLKNQLSTNDKIDKLETRMDRVEDRLDKIEVKIDKIDNRLDKIEITTDAILTLLKNKN